MSAKLLQDHPLAGPHELAFLPLGGSGEIGMNLNLYGHDGKWLMIDLGVTFADDISMPGIEVVMPDTRFIEEYREELVGLVLTHAHEDHIGAVPYLWRRLRCPIYATPFTASLLRAKLAEAGLLGEAKITEVAMSGRFAIAPFELELITLTHSIPEPNAVVVRTPVGTVLHTGDWKFDPDPVVGPTADEAALQRLGAQGVLAMICDSTNIFVRGKAGSEAAVQQSLLELVGQCRQRVVIACFASNVARLQTIATVAHAHHRQMALVGRSLWRVDAAARENGYLAGVPRFLGEDEIEGIPRNRLLLVCTGSQGEPRAALSRIATEQHPNVELEPGDTVIFSSRIIPGNEKRIGLLHDKLIRLGVEVITERDHFVHVSGHPARDELAHMYQLVQPQTVIPVHGEARHLAEHAQFARSCQVPHTLVPHNGSLIRLAPGPAEVIDEVFAGRLAVDGHRLVPIDAQPLRVRAKLAAAGAAVATVVIDRRGHLVGDPQLSALGLFDPDADAELHARAVDAVAATVDGLAASARGDDDAVTEAVRRSLRRTLQESLGKRPHIDVHLVRL